MRTKVLINGVIFALLFVVWVVVLFLTTGKQVDATGTVVDVPNLYLHNYLDMWGWLIAFLLGVVLVLSGIAAGAFTSSRNGIWLSGIGTILVVISLFCSCRLQQYMLPTLQYLSPVITYYLKQLFIALYLKSNELGEPVYSRSDSLHHLRLA